MYISEALTYNCSRIRTAASLLFSRASSIGLSPTLFLMLIDAPCLTNNAMASGLFHPAAQCTAVLPERFRLFTSAPFCRSNRMTSVLLYCPANMSAVRSSQLSWMISTGTPARSKSSHLYTLHHGNGGWDCYWFLWKKQLNQNSLTFEKHSVTLLNHLLSFKRWWK